MALDAESNAAPSRREYLGAIALSALGHLVVAVLALVVAPRYLRARQVSPPVYTVKIVDATEAGDLGTHLPRLASTAVKHAPKPPPPAVEQPRPKPPAPPEKDKNVVALANLSTPTATFTPPPTPAPTLTPQAQTTPQPAPKTVEKPKPKSTRAIQIAKAEPTPSVEQRLAEVRRQLLAHHLAEKKKAQAAGEEEEEQEPDEQADRGGGPVVAGVATEGAGAGIGPGTGSAGIQKDLDFLLYYRTVQERVKKAWNFSGGSADLTTTVLFAINPDGSLAGVKITSSSRDGAFDESVLRAIRRAAPFPAPPQKYREQFAQGIEALFKLGELSS